MTAFRARGAPPGSVDGADRSLTLAARHRAPAKAARCAQSSQFWVRASEAPCLSNGNKVRFKASARWAIGVGSRDGLHP